MKYFLSLFLCLTLAACAAPTPAPETVPLAGTRWTLRSLNGRPLLPGTAITLKFEADRLHGRAGCNSYEASYTPAPGGGLRLGGTSQTEIACPEPEGLMGQEAEYTRALRRVDRYERSGTGLLLMNQAAGVLLQYRVLPEFDVDPADLTGTLWQLASAPGLVGLKPDLFTLRFDENSYEGVTPCRDYEGAYSAEEDSLAFESMSLGKDVICSEKDTRAEERYTSLLVTVWQYNLTETQLDLFTGGGETLVFVPSTLPTATPGGGTPAGPGGGPSYP